MARWFAFQSSLSGKGQIPTVFHDERPVSKAWQRRVIPGSLREIPEALHDASLTELAKWFEGE